MPLITAAQLQLFARRSDYLAIAPHLDHACVEAGIDTPREVRHFMAQMHHESLGFTRLTEDLNYSAARLCAVWPTRFPTLSAAKSYAMNPKLLAERVYGGRLGNGPAGSGDGWTYIGRSWVMITGKAAYALAGAWTGVDLVKNPQRAADPRLASVIAAQWWKHHGLSEVVAKDPGERAMANIDQKILFNELDDVRQARKIINGGRIGIDDVIAQLRRAAPIWPD